MIMKIQYWCKIISYLCACDIYIYIYIYIYYYTHTHIYVYFIYCIAIVAKDFIHKFNPDGFPPVFFFMAVFISRLKGEWMY